MNLPDNFSSQLTDAIMKIFSGSAQFITPSTKQEEVKQQIYKILHDTGLDEKMAVNYSAVESHKKRMRDKYQHGVDALEEMFPNGMFTKNTYGELVGIDVMMKTTVRELLELESSKTPKL